MFTGIVDHVAVISACESSAQGLRLLIQSQFDKLQPGESIAVDGACLTVVEPREHQFSCSLSPETLEKTIARDYHVGCNVNLERSMRASDRFGGHYVTGHVDGVCVVDTLSPIDEYCCVRFSGVPSAFQRYLMPKGSITVSGVSLTINDVFPGGFEVMLIPHTCEVTHFHALAIGDRVNIEYDWMIKAVSLQLAHLNSQEVSL